MCFTPNVLDMRSIARVQGRQPHSVILLPGGSPELLSTKHDMSILIRLFVGERRKIHYWIDRTFETRILIDKKSGTSKNYWVQNANWALIIIIKSARILWVGQKLVITSFDK